MAGPSPVSPLDATKISLVASASELEVQLGAGDEEVAVAVRGDGIIPCHFGLLPGDHANQRLLRLHPPERASARVFPLGLPRSIV